MEILQAVDRGYCPERNCPSTSLRPRTDSPGSTLCTDHGRGVGLDGRLDDYDIHPSMRQQIGDYLSGQDPYLG